MALPSTAGRGSRDLEALGVEFALFHTPAARSTAELWDRLVASRSATARVSRSRRRSKVSRSLRITAGPGVGHDVQVELIRQSKESE